MLRTQHCYIPSVTAVEKRLVLILHLLHNGLSLHSRKQMMNAERKKVTHVTPVNTTETIPIFSTLNEEGLSWPCTE